jgi:hypothetical protein
MANADILCGLRDACERWSRGELGTDDLYHAVLGHLSALEGTGPWTTRAVQAFPDRITRACRPTRQRSTRWSGSCRPGWPTWRAAPLLLNLVIPPVGREGVDRICGA